MSALAATACADPLTFTLAYTASTSCPHERDFMQRLRSRTSAAERVSTSGDVEVAVSMEVLAGGARGFIAWRRGTDRTRRAVNGESCSEVASALALILALALDPDAGASPAPQSREPVEPKPAPSSRQPLRATAPAPSASRWYPMLGVAAGAAGGVAPGLRPYVGARAALGRDTGGLWAPRAQLALSYARGTSRTPAGSAVLSLWTLRAGLCPVNFIHGASFVRPCATFDLGRLSARGYATRDARAGAAPWYGPGLALGVGRRVLDACFVELEGGMIAPLVRDWFYFEPNESAARIPKVTGYFGVVLGAGG